MLGEPTYAAGGRTGFKGKKFDPKRRGFLKLAAGLASIPLIGKYFKWAKPLAKSSKVLTQVPIKNIEGMPAWFKPLVNRVIKEGDDVTKKFATADREIVHTKKLEECKFADEVTVTQNLDEGTIRVQYNTPNSMGEYGVDLNYKAGEIIEPPIIKEGKLAGHGKGVKTEPEFSAVEAEPRVMNRDGDIEWDGENVVNIVEDLNTDTSKLKSFATGKKSNMKEIATKIKKDKYVNDLNSDTMNQVDYIETKYGPAPDDVPDHIPDDYSKMASGGRVPLRKGKKVRTGVPSDVTTSGLLDINFDNLDLEEWFDILRSLGVSEHASGGRVPLAGGKLAQTLIQQIIKKYKGRIDDKLLKQMLVDDNPQRLAEVMATVDEALLMQGKGMGPETIMQTMRESWKRKKNASGGRVSLSSGGLAGMLGE